MTQPPDHWVAVGRLGRPHGIKGELTVEVRTNDPDQRFAVGTRLLRVKGVPLVVEKLHWHSGRLLVSVEGIGDRNAAETLRDTVVHADTTLDPDLGDDDFYDHQLVGLRVELVDGELVGRVADVLHPPGADLLAVTREGKDEVLIPFVRALVPTVDRAAGRVVLIPPPGLLDQLD